MKINYSRKSTISVKMFISEFGEEFSEHVKDRLMDLEQRCFLTRKNISYIVDLKHVEHIQYTCPSVSEKSSDLKQKEYAYGQFAAIEGILYFSENCIENDKIMKCPMVTTIYNSIDSDIVTSEEGTVLKKLDDSNIDYVIDSILSSCPEVSQKYLDIVKGMMLRANNKTSVS